jgi:hypothetical protein
MVVGKNIWLDGLQTEKASGKLAVWKFVACRISQIDGTERSMSLFVSEVCRA